MNFPGSLHRRVFAVSLLLSIVVIIVAILLGIFKYPDRSSPDHYFGEGKFPTGLSVVLLVVTGVFLFLAFLRRRRADAQFSLSATIWLAGAVAFIFFALDEGFKIHENLDLWIHSITGMTETAHSDRIDDFIILGYGVVGAITLVLCRREVLRFRGAWPYVLFAAVAAIGSVGLDILTNGNNLIQGKLHGWASAVEDCLKLFAEVGFIAAAAFVFTEAASSMAAGGSEKSEVLEETD